MSVAIGIDIGGTAIKAGMVTQAGRILCKRSIPTKAEEGAGPILDRVAGLIAQLQQQANVSDDVPPCDIGVGMPGSIDRVDGVVISSPNFEDWHHVPLVEHLETATGRRIVLDNDANNAAWGEFRCGAGQGSSSMVLLTLGTGIGCGVILQGKLWRGATGDAGELGHTILVIDGRRCACGQLGCLEAYASALSTARRFTERIGEGESSRLRDVLDRGDEITCEQIVQAADQGDVLAGEVWQETCQYLATACLNVHHLLNPDCIVFSGGMSAAGESLRQRVDRAIQAMNSKTFGGLPDVRIATLGNDAGFIGAALSAWQDD